MDITQGKRATALRKVEDIAKLRRGHCLWAALLVATAVALLLASLAPAEGPPARAEYVSQLEGICKPHALATQRTMKGVRAEVEGRTAEACREKVLARHTTL